MLEDNLTRAEAQARARAVRDVSYEIALDLTGGEASFVSDTTVRFAVADGAAGGEDGEMFVDLDALAVRQLSLNGQRLGEDAFDSARSRIRLSGLQPTNELQVVAECAYQHTGVGLHRTVDPVDGHTYIHSQFEPYDAHRVFACFDQPDLKATIDLRVTAPDDWLVVSNTHVDERRGSDWRFGTTPLVPTYLAAVVAGPYHRVEDRHRGIQLALYCRESLAPHLDPDELFALTRQGLDFFESEFGFPFPFDKYEQAFVPEFNFGAMENPGCVTFNEGYLFRSRVTDAARESRANVLLHEMAHMWFGDLVTMRWWDDLWLNESFATYMATDAQVRATRFTDTWVRFAWDTKASAVRQDQLPSTHPISADIVDTRAVRLHFDGITYSKGASVLKQLVAWVGRDAFAGGVRSYFPRHQWSNAELRDFLGALESASERDLTDWSRQWLETAGVNTLRASFEVDDAGRYRSFAIDQEAPPDHPTLRSHRLAVGVYQLGDAGVVRSQRLELDVTGPRTEVPELAGVAVPDLLLLNDDDLTYAKIRLDPRSLETVEQHLSAVVDPLARTLCWAAAWDMVRDAELAIRRYVALVAIHGLAEPDDTTLQYLLSQASAGIDAYGDPANRPAARAALAQAARGGFESASAGSDRQLLFVRAFISTADQPDDLAFLRGLLDGATELPQLAVDTDLRWALVAALAASAADDDGRLIEAEVERDPTDIGQRRAAAARASRPTPEAKAEAWRLTVEQRPPPHLAMTRAVASGFARWGQVELVRPYVERYFESLGRFWDERTPEEALTLTGGLFPSVVVEDEVVATTETALADPSLPGPAHRVLLESKDQMQRSLRARAADRG